MCETHAHAKRALAVGDIAARAMAERLDQWGTGRNREGVDKNRLDAAMANALKEDVKETWIGVYQKELRASVKRFNEMVKMLRGPDKKGIDKPVTSAANKLVEETLKISEHAQTAVGKAVEVFRDDIRVVTGGVSKREDNDQKEGA